MSKVVKKDTVKHIGVKVDNAMSDNEKYFVKQLLVLESEGLPVKKRAQIFQSFKDGKITLNNLQSCLDRIQEIRNEW